MTSVHYAIGFTLAFCASLFYGINDVSTYAQQSALIFAGFCLGGVVVILLEEL
jgi:hypothetical protein